MQACTDMLHQLVADAGEHGVQRIFLRLLEDSEIIPAAQQAGFFPYKSETLFLMRRGSAETAPATLSREWVVRPKSTADHAALFRLYSASVPIPVREAEALTLQQWLANRDGADGSRFRRELIGEKDGDMKVWLQSVVASGSHHMELMCAPDATDGLRAVVEIGLHQSTGTPVVYWLVPDYLEGAQAVLQDIGCLEVCRFKALAKQLTVRTPRSFLVPAKARTVYSEI